MHNLTTANLTNSINLIELLHHRAVHQPNRIAYTFLVDGEIEEVSLTYLELEQQARAVAVRLINRGAIGERALLLYPPGIEFIIAFWGCLYAGVIAVPVYPPRRNQRMTRLQGIVLDSQAKFALTTTSILGAIAKSFSEETSLTSLHCIATDDIPVDPGMDWHAPSLAQDALAFLQYTSGSTGAPKGVMVSHGNLMHNSAAIQQYFGHTSDSQGVIWLPLYHDMGLIGGVLQPLYSGFPVTLMSPVDFLQKPIRWLQAISRYQATTSGGPNFAYDLCVRKVKPEQLTGLNLSSWELAFTGAEPVRVETIGRFVARFEPYGFQRKSFYPCYGMAETTLIVSGGSKSEEPIVQIVDARSLEQNQVVVSNCESGTQTIVGCGQCVSDQKILIVDPESLISRADTQVGEIWVSGPSLAQGYWNRSEETKQTFHAFTADTNEGPFLRTGDLGFLQDGELFITGRLKDVIIIRGRNHYPQDIELTVEQSHPALKLSSGAAFGIEIDGEERLVVVQEVERTYLQQLKVEEVSEAICIAVSQHHELQVYEVVLLRPGNIPKTSSGKIQRYACRAGFLDGTLDAVNEIAKHPPNKGIAPKLEVQNIDNIAKKIQFSLLYFSSNEAEFADDKYKLFFEGASFADRNGFTAVWTPERHFHAFGGLYPNPSVISAALASATKHIRIRAGSVVMPLHHPIRVAEEWSVVDNLSDGRVDLAFARGWNPNDFVLAPDTYADSKEVMFSGIQTLQKLWRGESVRLSNGVGKETEIKIYPLPKQRELSIWITCTGGKERFVEAGAGGFNILTALLFQPIEELAEKILLYRQARTEHGYDPNGGHITLMLHTFVGEDLETVRNLVREPFIEYIKSSVNLWRQGSKNLDELTPIEQEKLLAYAFERYFHTSALFGTPSTCLEMVKRLQEIGVDEIACLIDFGISGDVVLANLNYLNELRKLANGGDDPSTTRPDLVTGDRLDATEQAQPRSLLADFGSKTKVSGGFESRKPATIADESLIRDRQTQIATRPGQIEAKQLLDLSREIIVRQIARSLEKTPDLISINKSFHSLGIDSLKAIEIMETLGTNFDISLSPTLLFEYPTLADLTEYLVRQHGEKLEQYILVNHKLTPLSTLPLQPSFAISDPSRQVGSGSIQSDRSSVREEDIAVIGMSCRFPKSPDLDSFWQLLSTGKDAICEVPEKRWRWQDWYSEDPQATSNRTYSRWGGFVDDIDLFDPLFFQISPREAELMDPQQRIFLEVAWECLEHAGYAAASLAQTPVGVFVGCSNNGYYQRIAPKLTASDYSAGIGNQNAIIANRVSFLLNLRGPSVLVDTMCSSSLVSLHAACQSIRQGECSMAIAGGVNLQLSPEYYVAMSRMKMHSPDGRCKTFDSRANGIVLGEGAGAVLLKPLRQALADGDTVYATIKGSAVNHDGQTNGLTAPNPRSHAEAIAQALAGAGLSADRISYVEAHGTGTSLGDPIEIEGLTKAFRQSTQHQQFCRIGSVKTNIGHLESAAGIAQVIKVILALQHRQIPPSLHFEQSNPLIPFAETPFIVNTQLRAWESEGSRRAGLSSFGIGGTNAHIILEEAPVVESKTSSVERPIHLLTLSAKTDKALLELVDRYATHLAAHSTATLADICFTANTGRSHFSHRLSIVADSTVELCLKLSALKNGQKLSGVYLGQAQETAQPKIAFLFTGQGSQYVGMGRQLYETQPTFRQTLDLCAEILKPHLDRPLLSVLYPQSGEPSRLDRTEYTQPALFALEYALAQLWRSWGVEPTAVMGHSVGEYVAACVAGIFSLEDGLKLIAERARLMQNLPPGEMVAVFASEAEILALVALDPSKVVIAAYNGEQNTAISGEPQAVRNICSVLEAKGIQTRKLATSHAFHSPLVEPILEEFYRVAATVTYHAPQIDFISNVTGERMTAENLNPEYWCHHLRSSVQYAKSLQTLHSSGQELFVEIGPKPILLGMGRKCLLEGQGVWLPSLRQGYEDWQQILQSLGELYVHGVRVDWSSFDRDYSRRRVQLPTYPFQRKSYWIQTQEKPQDSIPEDMGNDMTLREHIGASPKSAVLETNATDRPKRSETILEKLHSLMANLLKADPEDIDFHTPFLEIGADSLMLVDAVSFIESTYGIKITIGQLFEELSTLDALASYIDHNLPPEMLPLDSHSVESEPNVETHQPLKQPVRVAAPVGLIESIQREMTATPTALAEQVKLAIPNGKSGSTFPDAAISETSLERIVMQQLQVMSQLMTEQLDVLRGKRSSNEKSPVSHNGNSGRLWEEQNGQSNSTHEPTSPVVHLPRQALTQAIAKHSTPTVPKVTLPLESATTQNSNSLQTQHLQAFISGYTQRTKTSKLRAQTYRSVLADSRAVAGFRPSTKELVYPIVGERAQGARIWDVDGNEYIDLTMGFGVLLFGHAAPFITQALEEQIQRGIQIGPQSDRAGEVAELICELTGMERVAFCNSGTEAVMTALRLARAATGRTKIALFAGSYHGHSDGVLAKALPDQLGAAAIAPGVSPHAIADTIVLEYGQPQSLEILQAHAHELAAVLVEPVQARRPDLQPREFLQQLRQFTASAGVALIFDEVLVGFRIHPGGAQAWFGIEADIATYGKIIGGGLPIGVVAGKATYLNGIDGGLWHYGDASYPAAEKTFFAGTFNKNHLGMSVARAALRYMKEKGAALHQELNQRTERLAIALNDFFESEAVPIRIVHFGSLFRFDFSGNFDLLFYHLLSRGIYIWEGRNCFLSTAHSDRDIDDVIQAVKDSVKALQIAGLIAKRSVRASNLDESIAASTAVGEQELKQLGATKSASLLPVIPRDGTLPLSLAQQRLWFLDQLDSNSAFYNLPAAVRLQGKLNVPVLEQSLQEIIHRHESLRTNFVVKDGQPFQIIHSEIDWKLDVVDLQHLPAHKREDEAQRSVIAEAQRSFDLATDPLVRATLWVLSGKDFILLMTVHHIISDGWSMAVLVQETAALYTAFCQGQPSPLSELPIQYVDFAVWQRQWLRDDVLQSQLTYWRQQLAGAPTVLELPSDRPRPTMQTVRGAHQPFRLSLELSEALRKLSRKEGTTLFMTLLAAFDVLLYRYTGQSDFIVGSPIANRNRPETQGLIGYFLNILLLRADLSGNPSFQELLKRGRKVALGAYAHQDVPFEELIEVLQPIRDLSHTPLFQVMFILDNANPLSERQLPDLTWMEMSVENFTAKLDLTLTLENNPSGLVGSWEYNTDLFDAATIAGIAEHFQTLLEGIVLHPEMAIAQLPMLTATEQQQLLVEWNNTQADYPLDQCIHHLIEQQVERTPDAIAVVFEDRHLTYQELNQRANQLAHYLKERGVGTEVLVGICLDRSLNLIVALLAILKAGGAYIPLDPNYPPERLELMLSDSKASVLLTTSNLQPQSSDRQIQLIYLDTHWTEIATHNDSNPNNPVQPEQLAYTIYTSGSTGTPKGVMVTHCSLVNAYWAWESAYKLRTRTRSHLQMANFSFDVFTGDLVRALCSGSKLVLCPREFLLSPPQLYQLMREQAVDCAEFVPAVIRNLVEYLEKTAQHLDFMQILVVGSDSWYVQEYLSFQRFCGPQTRLINSYGVSEATIDSSYFEITAANNLPADALVPIGKPFDNTQLYVLDAHMQAVPVGVPGELHVGGSGLARGYCNRPELTQERFVTNPFSSDPQAKLYKTGDLVRFLPDGNLELLGRIDNQVKLRGFRIELGEIESLLSQHPSVAQAAAIVREDVAGDKRLVAYLVGTELEASANDLRQFLKERLPEYMVPAAFVFLDALPLTPNGKVDRRALPAPDLAQQLEKSFVAPRTPIEQTLAGIWAEVLGVEQVGIYDSFFELGGHSLLATQLVSRVRAAFQVELPLRKLFEATTVATLAECIQALQHDTDTPQRSAPPLRPMPRDGQLPLSFAQQRLWFLDRLEPNSPFYNISSAVRLQGNLNLTALEHSLNEIVRRHEALRTSFISQDGQAIQIVRPTLAWKLAVVDLQDLSERERSLETQRLAIAEAQRPFDLENDPLVRATLLVVGETERVLLLTMHHIVSDGWSMGVFVREIVTLYAAFQQGRLSPLPELSIQYADFAVWQRQWLQGEVLEAQIDYWQQQLANIPSVLELPADRPRPAVQSFSGAQQVCTLPVELTKALDALGRQEGATSFMVLLAAFDLLLYRYTEQTDILVGSPIANRHHGELEDAIGFFVNTLVLRTDLSGNPNFRELLGRVKEMTLAAYDHQDLPFELLVEALQPERNLSHTPLFQVAFVLQNAPMPKIELSELTLSPFAVDNRTSKFDLTLTIEEAEEGYVGLWEYNTDLFNAVTIALMAGHYQTLLESIVAKPERPICELPILSAAEQHQLLNWNDTQTDYPRDLCIHQAFEQQVELTPDAIAVVFAEGQLTYRELNSRANQLARYLQTLGVREEALVGLCVERSLDLVVGMLGILKAGGAYVPLDPNYPQERLNYMLSDAQVSVLLTQQQLVRGLPELQVKAVCLDSDWQIIAAESKDNLPCEVKPDNLAYVIYTSGSTGKPKGVMVPHCAVNRLVLNTDYVQLGSGDRIAQASNASFDAATFEIWGALLNGARLVGVPQHIVLSLQEFADYIREHGINVLFLTTALFNQIASFVPQAFGSLRYLLFGGEAVDPRWVREVLQNGSPQHLLHVYGPTENTTYSSWFLVREVDETATTIPIGSPIANTQIYVLDGNMQPVPVGVPGELHVGGDGLARGYLNRPELTQEKFVPNPFSPDPQSRLYKTGDLVRYLPDGNIEYIGRIDNQVKIRGFRIELGEIETALLSHPAVLQAVAIAREDELGRKRLVSYVVCDIQQVVTSSELRQFLKEKLPEYVQPSACVLVESFPLTPNGKIDRRALPVPDLTQQLEDEFIAPRTEVEQKLAEIWTEVLGVPQVGVRDNFFALGGDSILSLQIVARANQVGIQLTPKQLFGNQTIAELAAVAGTAKQIQTEQGLVIGTVPLTPIQQWFFEQEQSEPHHFNQSVMLSVPADLNPDCLEQALQYLVRHHDALRLRFDRRTENVWEQSNAGLDNPMRLQVVDLSAALPEAQLAELERIGSEQQVSFDLSDGLLMRAMLFQLGSDRPSRLLLIVHHLAVDGVSWRILLEDLLHAYQQVGRGESVRLPPKTTSFKDWATRLVEYGQSDTIATELDYWLADVEAIAVPLPTDYPASPEVNTFGAAAQVSVALSEEQTRALLQEVPAAYHTQINDVLLTAMVQSFARWTGDRSLRVNLEGHGREDLFEDLDVSRTVGWFTSIFPVRLELPEDNHPGNALKLVKEQLRRIPNRGIGYGILYYLNRQAERLKALPNAEVSFNYLGQFDRELSTSPGWEFDRASGGAEHSARERRSHLLEANGLVANGRLQINWIYCEKIHHRSTIERLAQWFIEALQALVEHCQSPEAGGFTPSDFPEAELSQEEIDEIMLEFIFSKD